MNRFKSKGGVIKTTPKQVAKLLNFKKNINIKNLGIMENLKTQIESVRDYAYKRLSDGDFVVIDCFYDENLESVRVVVEIDSYMLDLIMLKKNNHMFQSAGTIRNDVILFHQATEAPTRIKELAKEKLEEYNSNKKELEIKRLEEKLKELKNQ